MPPEVRRPHPSTRPRPHLQRPAASARPRPSLPPQSYRARRPAVQRFDLRTVLVGLVATLLVATGLPVLGNAAARDVPEVVAVPPVPTLTEEIEGYLAGRSTTASVLVWDLVSGQQYAYRADARYDSASVVKVALLAATLRRAEQAQRPVSAKERRLLGRMIRHSDNGAASTLWNSLGRGAGLDAFFSAAGMARTKAGPRGYWGLTRVTAADQVRLMGHLTRPGDLLSEDGRAYARSLLADVDDDQDWGVSAGPAAAGATVELKNGWLPRGRRGWAVHSVGHVQGEGRDYLIAVLSLDNASQRKGIRTVEGVSTLVWQRLAPR